MDYEITTGKFFFCIPGNQMHYRLHMKDAVSREDLQKAVDTAMIRYPYLRTEVVRDGGHFYLKENNKPFAVYQGENHIPPGDSRNGGHLFSFGCDDEKIFVNFFHGIADGRGSLDPALTVLHYYILYHYGEDLRCDGLKLADEMPSTDEYADPLSAVSLAAPPAAPVQSPSPAPTEEAHPERPFIFPADKVLPPEDSITHILRVPQCEFMPFVRQLEASPAAIMALFLSKAIYRIFPEYEDSIVIESPVDARDALGIPATMQNCLSAMRFTYDKRIGSMPIELQATCYRGMMFLQNDPDVIIEKIRGMKGVIEYIGEQLENNQSIGELPQPVVPVISYVGKVDAGDMKRYFNGISAAFCPETEPMITVFADDEGFNISYNTRACDGSLYRAFLDEFTSAGILWHEVESVPSPPIPRALPSVWSARP